VCVSWHHGRERIIRWGGEEGFTGRATIGYDHGYDGEIFYLGLALDERYVEGWVEGCLERIGEDYPEEEQLFRDLFEDEIQREVVIESLKADCEIRTGRPAGLWDIGPQRSEASSTHIPEVGTCSSRTSDS
jgi:hypothetical protein